MFLEFITINASWVENDRSKFKEHFNDNTKNSRFSR